MKKYLIPLLFIVFFAPTVTFAQAQSQSQFDLINTLLKQIQILQQQLILLQKDNKVDDESEKVETISIKPGKTYESYRNGHINGVGSIRQGKYNIAFSVTSGDETLYVPTSFGSGTTTGIVYEIEGSGEAEVTSTVTCKGDGIKTSRVGSVLFCKIPPGKTADFKIVAQIAGEKGDEFSFVINRINYKTDPNRAKYTAYKTDMSTGIVIFK